MKTKLLILLIIITFVACSNDTGVETKPKVSASDKLIGDFEMSGEHNLAADNPLGMITISGTNAGNTVKTYLYRIVFAETRELAEQHLSDILLDNSSSNDSMICTINSPASNSIDYLCSYSLELSNNIAFHIKAPNNGVKISNMDTTVYVSESYGSIEITQQTGSCDLKTSKGDISAQVFLNENDFCRCYTSEGNIVLEIPANINAILYSKADSGTVSFSNLTITDKQQTTNSLTGTLGDVKGEIRLESIKGNITITGISGIPK